MGKFLRPHLHPTPLRTSQNQDDNYMRYLPGALHSCSQSPVEQGWPFTLREGCGAEVRKLPQWLFTACGGFGIVQKVFSEKASAIARMRQKCVRNTSEMRQKWVLLYWEKRNVQYASEIRQNCVKNSRNTFGGEHLLDDTDGWQIFSKNEMRESDIFQVVSNVSLVAETGCEEECKHAETQIARELNAEKCVNYRCMQ